MNDDATIEQTVYDLTIPTSCTEVVMGILIQHGFSTFQELESGSERTVYRIWTSPTMTATEITSWFSEVPNSISARKATISTASNERREVVIGEFRLFSDPANAKGPSGICLLDGVGFGWGEHPTTKLGLAYLSSHFPSGLKGHRCLDFGAGTGVLSFAAARCGATHIDAVEVDDASLYTLRNNAAANQLSNQITIQTNLSDCDGGFDLILANMYVDVLLMSLSELSKRLKPAARLWISGFTAERMDEILKETTMLGLIQISVDTSDGWVSIELGKKPSEKGVS